MSTSTVNNARDFIPFLVVMLMTGGWVANIVKLIQADVFGALETVRLVGIFLAPIGSLLGLFV